MTHATVRFASFVLVALSIAPSLAAEPVVAPMQTVPLNPQTTFAPFKAGDAEGPILAGAEKLIYASTLGTAAVAIPPGVILADEITTTVSDGCRIRRMELPVVGKVDPQGMGGPYSIDFAIFRSCPNSVPPHLFPFEFVGPGFVRVNFPDDAPRLLSFNFPGEGVFAPQTFWLAIRFNRANAGLVVGAPALTGFSCDLIDFPGAGSACNTSFGGFPDHPYANFNVAFFSDASCSAAFAGYKSSRPTGVSYNPGVGVRLLDEIQLVVPGCRMTGYDVAVRGAGSYSFEFRGECDNPAIEGTARTISVPSGTEPRVLRFDVDPPVDIPWSLFFAATVDNPSSGVVISGEQACVGRTEQDFMIQPEGGGCARLYSPLPGVHTAIDLTVYCEGEPPLGACCDYYLTDAQGEAVCREVPRMNCAFPWPPYLPQPDWGSPLRHDWNPGDVCEPDPFSPPCGVSACCKPDGTCQNLTQNQCNAVEPVDTPRLWQRGFVCGASGQYCGNPVCFAAPGDCDQSHDTPGCSIRSCCNRVCAFDSFCCDVEWDAECVSHTELGFCDTFGDPGDECAANSRVAGASLLPVPGTAETGLSFLTESDSDPGFGCYVNNPGARAFQTHWYKFIAPPAVSPATRSIVNIQTCGSASPANDSLLQVFAVGDASDQITQCNSLIPVGCNDDFAGPACTRVNTLSRICLRDLIPGNPYYIQVGSKTRQTNSSARFRVEISQVTTCVSQLPDSTNDYCPRATNVADGTTPFNLGRAAPPYTLDLLEICIPATSADMWFRYEATCTGALEVKTCGASADLTPDTNLAVYSSCPTTMVSKPLACSQDAGGNCGLGSIVRTDVVRGHSYVIRLGDQAENYPSGNLSISCTPATCPAGAMSAVTDGLFAVLSGTIDPRRPHDPADPKQLETVQTLLVTTTRDAQPSCFSLCESTSTDPPNAIMDVTPGLVEDLRQTFTIKLARPITPGAITTVSYTPDDGEPAHLRLLSHPANVNGDGEANDADVQTLRDALARSQPYPYALLILDIDRSNNVTPADLLEEVDLLNGAGTYEPWRATRYPSPNPACP